MHPEDRVLVGVIKRKKDFKIAREQLWYRVPHAQLPKGVHTNYIGLFFGRGFGEQASRIAYYAEISGHELVTRLDLLPNEPNHKHAHAQYYKLQFRELLAKIPPILNTRKRRFAFIHTTWDRFEEAKEIEDLYSTADHLVDRVFYALKESGYEPQRTWEAPPTKYYPAEIPSVRIVCRDGEVVASTDEKSGILIAADSLHETLQKIQIAIEQYGGPIMLSTPLD